MLFGFIAGGLAQVSSSPGAASSVVPRIPWTHLTIHSAAAAPAALTAVAIAGGITMLAVLPAMYALFGVFARPVPEVIE